MAIEHRTRRPVRQEPHTIDGITHIVEVELPAVPRDWDHTALRGAITFTIAILVAAMAWSTASIGALLALTAPAVFAYTAAAVFDATWIVALTLEWLGRYHRARAAAARRVGHIALGVAMAAIIAHGCIFGSPWAGAFGACISAAAKVVTTLLMSAIARPLDPRTAQWVEAETNAANARLAMIPVRRHLARAHAALDAEQAALDNATTYIPAVPHDAPLILAPVTSHKDDTRTSEDTVEDDTRTREDTASPTVIDTVRRLLDSGITDLDHVVLGVQAEHGPVTRKTISNARNLALKAAVRA